MYCPNCGKEIEDNSKFCEHCGVLLCEQKTGGGQEKKKRTKYMIIGGVSVIISIILAVLFVMDFIVHNEENAAGEAKEAEKIENTLAKEDAEIQEEPDEPEMEEKMDYQDNIIGEWSGALQHQSPQVKDVTLKVISTGENSVDIELYYLKDRTFYGEGTIVGNCLYAEGYVGTETGYELEAVFDSETNHLAGEISPGYKFVLTTFNGQSYAVEDTTDGDYENKLLRQNKTTFTAGGVIGAVMSDQVLQLWKNTTIYNFESQVENIKYVSAGSEHVYALTLDGELYSWGNNNHGQLGTGGYYPQTEPVKIMDRVIAVLAGEYDGMAIKRDGSLWYWGGYKRDINPTVKNDEPFKILDDVIGICPGYAVKSDGTLWKVGSPIYQEDGSYHMTQVMSDIKAVDSNPWVTAVIKTDGTLWMWGQIGTNNDKTEEPKKIFEHAAAVRLGSKTYFAIMENGELYSWGKNDRGLLGNGGGESSLRPTKIMDHVLDVCTDGFIGMAVTNDGALYMWGSSAYSSSDGAKIESDGKVPTKIKENISLPAY